jgi:hypothetical protein
MEVGQGQDLGCSAKGKKELLMNLDTYKVLYLLNCVFVI